MHDRDEDGDDAEGYKDEQTDNKVTDFGGSHNNGYQRSLTENDDHNALDVITSSTHPSGGCSHPTQPRYVGQTVHVLLLLVVLLPVH